MPRKIPAHRFDDLIRSATEVFTAFGYQRTQMAGIADGVGVSKGTLYLYVESKESLLRLCLLHADNSAQIETPEVLPVPRPPAGLIAEEVAERIRAVAQRPVLHAALDRPRASNIRQELREVLDELYTLIESNCRAIRLIERCSDHPELGPIWQSMGRDPGRQQLAQYVEARIRAGQLHATEHPQLASRIALETVATWAMHIKWDPAPEPYDPESAKAGVIEQICRGLLTPETLIGEKQ